jgi:hypothetical protein
MIDFSGFSRKPRVSCLQKESFFENHQGFGNYFLPEPLGNPYFLKVPTSSAFPATVPIG